MSTRRDDLHNPDMGAVEERYRQELRERAADLFKAHDFDRMECADHDHPCCPEGGCHDVIESQYEHYASVVLLPALDLAATGTPPDSRTSAGDT